MKLFGIEIFSDKRVKEAQLAVNKSFSAIPHYFNFSTEDILRNRVPHFKDGNIKQFVKWAETIPEVYAPISLLSKSFSNGKFTVWGTKENGELTTELPNDPINNILKNPNFFQGQAEFIKMLTHFYYSAGFAIIYRTKLIGFNENWFVLPSHLIEFDFQLNIIPHASFKLQDVVKAIYLHTYDGKRVSLDLDKIAIINSTGLYDYRSYYFGSSIMNAAIMPICNIELAYEASNVIMKYRGVEGIFTGSAVKTDYDVKNIPMDEVDKAAIQTAFKYNYGLLNHQDRFAFTNNPINYIPVGQDPSKLRIFETIKEHRATIANLFGILPVSLGYEDAKYLNMETADKKMYTNTVIPDANYIFNSINAQFGLQKELKAIVPDYSHISCLQPDKKLDAETSKINTQTIIDINNAVVNGTIDYDIGVEMLIIECGYSKKEARKLIHQPIIINEEISIDENAKFTTEQLSAQANLRGTVGGVQGILQIQTSVSQGITQYDAALSILMEIYGFDEIISRQILGEKRDGQEPNETTGVNGNAEQQTDTGTN